MFIKNFKLNLNYICIDKIDIEIHKVLKIQERKDSARFYIKRLLTVKKDEGASVISTCIQREKKKKIGERNNKNTPAKPEVSGRVYFYEVGA